MNSRSYSLPVIHTKLHRPSVTPDYVNRDELDARLAAVRKEFRGRGIIYAGLTAEGIPEDKIKIERTVGNASAEDQEADPMMDRAIVVNMTGSMTEALE